MYAFKCVQTLQNLSWQVLIIMILHDYYLSRLLLVVKILIINKENIVINRQNRLIAPCTHPDMHSTHTQALCYTHGHTHTHRLTHARTHPHTHTTHLIDRTSPEVIRIISYCITQFDSTMLSLAKCTLKFQ